MSSSIDSTRYCVHVSPITGSPRCRAAATSRIASSHDTCTMYTFAPPANSLSATTRCTASASAIVGRVSA